jgi:hypothetical protein
MAFRQTIILESGITVEAAYRRVESVSISAERSMKAQVRTYAASDVPACHDASFVMSYDMNGTNPFCQAYMHLKALPEFASATDC